MVLALLSGTAKASGHPLYLSINPTIYLFSDKLVGYGPDTSNPILAKAQGGISLAAQVVLSFSCCASGRERTY